MIYGGREGLGYVLVVFTDVYNGLQKTLSLVGSTLCDSF